MIKCVKKIGGCLVISLLVLCSLNAQARNVKAPVIESERSQAIKGSKFKLERRGDAVVVVIPVKNNFHAKREGYLLPSSLRPLTNLAKIAKRNPNLFFLVLGHIDATKLSNAENLSLKRANSVASIFRVAGLPRSRMYLSGLDAKHPKANNKTAKGKALNNRVEIVVINKPYNQTLVSLADKYSVANLK